MSYVEVQGTMALAEPAASAWLALVAEVQAATGIRLTISSPGGAWRSEAMVLDMWRNPAKYGANHGTAKPRSLGGPGSVHENGLCVDIWNWASLGTPSLDTYATRHGFRRTIAAEPWHYQHNGTSTAGGGLTPFENGEETMYAIREPGGGITLIRGPYEATPLTLAEWQRVDGIVGGYKQLTKAEYDAEIAAVRKLRAQLVADIAKAVPTSPGGGASAAAIVDELLGRLKA